MISLSCKAGRGSLDPCPPGLRSTGGEQEIQGGFEQVPSLLLPTRGADIKPARRDGRDGALPASRSGARQVGRRGQKHFWFLPDL